MLLNDRKMKSEAKKGDLYFSYLGSEFVGEIIDVGPNVKNFNIGDTVIPNISYPSKRKDYMAGLPSNNASSRLEIFNSNKLIKIPENFHISDEILAAFPIAGFTSYGMIKKVLKPKAKVLITAARSNTSLAIINYLKNKNVEIYVMTSNSKFNNEFLKLGVSKVFVVDLNLNDFKENNDFKNVIDTIGGFDIIIDPFFDIYLPRVIDLIRMNGKYITWGLYSQFPNSEKNKYKGMGKTFHQIMIKAMINNISIIGNCLGIENDGLKALNDLKNGKFNIIIDSVFSKNQENLFLERTFNSNSRFGKVVYTYKD